MQNINKHTLTTEESSFSSFYREGGPQNFIFLVKARYIPVKKDCFDFDNTTNNYFLIAMCPGDCFFNLLSLA